MHFYFFLESCKECKNLANEIDFLKKRVLKLEKVYSVIKKNSSFDQTVNITADVSHRYYAFLKTEDIQLFLCY